MAVSEDILLAFNRGVVSDLVENRADVKRVGMSAEEQMNCMPRIMGPMSLRPGLQYIGELATANGVVRMIPFVFSNDDKALIEVTDEQIRVWEMDGLVTREATLSTLANQEFTSNLNSWVSADGSGAAVSSWKTGGYMSLIGSDTHAAARYQALSMEFNEPGTGKEYVLNIGIQSGVVGFRIGTSAGSDNIFTETYLGKGAHSLAFTPPGADAYIYFFNYKKREAVVDFCRLQTAEEPMAYTVNLLPTETLDDTRTAQSGDIIFVARGKAFAPVKIERRGRHSWSVVDYESLDGPFRAANVLKTKTLTPSAVSGSAITLTASTPTFTSGNVGGLFKLQSAGVVSSATLNVQDSATEAIKVTGVGDERKFDYTIAAGAWSGTVVFERSLVEEGRWTTVTSYNSGTTVTAYNDALDNQVVYYRLRASTALTGAGSTGTLTYALGTKTGIVRVEAYTSPTVVTCSVLKTLGSTTATSDWSEGAWSSRRGYPSAVAFYQGRLWWAGKDKVWASVTDDFYSFDEDYVGDAGPIQRSIGMGPVDTINWLCPLRQLVVGAEGGEYLCRSNNIEEPLTPANFNLFKTGDYGSSSVDVISVDGAAIFVDRTGARVLALSNAMDDAEILETSLISPELCKPSIKRVAVQRRPDTRIHFIRCDGTAVVLVYDKAEQVNCFVTVETQGLIEDVVVVPHSPEDWVFYVVVRVVDGVARRYLERWAGVDDAVGGERNKMLDSYYEYIGEPTNRLYNLDHLEGREVMVWGNNKYLGEFGVVNGSVALPETVSYAVAGLYYYGKFVSRKLGFLTQGSSVLSKRRRVVAAALMLRTTHKDAIQYGTDEDHLDYLPPMEAEAAVADDYQWDEFDTDPISFNGTIANDTKIVLKMHAPYPCTVTAAVVTLENL